MERTAAIAILLCAGALACAPGGLSGTEEGSENSGSSSTGPGESSGEAESTESSETSSEETETETESETGPPPPDLPLPDCEDPIIEGSVLIDQNSTPADLALLTCVEEIGGDLQIEDTTLESLDFLSSLVRVGGRLRVWNNDALLDLVGLSALAEVGGQLAVYGNDSLVDLDGLGSLQAMHGLWVAYNDLLVSVAGLSGDLQLHAQSPEDTEVQISIGGNDSLASLDGLAEITSLGVERPLTIRITNNEALVSDLFGLSPWIADDHEVELWVESNALASLAGLESLTSATSIHLLGVRGDYPSLAGLDNLTTVVDEFRIGACVCVAPEVQSECETDFGLEHLETLDGLESLTTVGRLRVWGNESLASIDALAGLVSAGDLLIEDNPLVSPDAVASVVAGVEVSGELWTNNNGTGQMPICGFIPW